MPRKIEDIYELESGSIVALTNDGRAFILPKKNAIFVSEWQDLPKIPQKGYKPPTDEEMEGTVSAIKKGMQEILKTFTDAGMLGHQHHMAHGPVSNKCPIEGCDFETKDVAEMTVHLAKKHSS